MSPIVWVTIGIMGAVGSASRYLIDGYVQDRHNGDLPWGTFTVNMIGSLILGFLTGLATHAELSTTGRAILGTGFCGALTTFSTFSFETARLIERGEWRGASINLFGSLTLGLVAAAAGLGLATLVV